MTTIRTRTYTYRCNCGQSGKISKSNRNFGSLDLEPSDIPRCINCKAVVCSSCLGGKSGLCKRCFAQIPPQLKESLERIQILSTIIPCFSSFLIFLIATLILPQAFGFFIIGGIFLTGILLSASDSNAKSKRQKKIEAYFLNQRSRFKSGFVNSNAYNVSGKRIENPRDFMNALSGEGFSINLGPVKQQMKPQLRESILKISREQKNKSMTIYEIAKQSGVIFPDVIRSTLHKMINNNNIKADFDEINITFH
ncbi:hypothetical protein DSAG12_01718 [Promethearchaeum syntrophicum]|uniref:Uncharacterized protein n=1 Tax=Promethearchaeum syntrophicum TaxID=2594042 RepID=A0A5B9DA72_9ARCH|nr:hypothetical protein [Candidatus Prometheoarchaeum syntrophicum]